MEIIDLCTAPRGAVEQDMVRIDPMTAIPRWEERTILQENHMKILLNGVPEETLVCTPAELSALVLGHLYTEGRIAGVEDVCSIAVSAEGAQAEAVTQGPANTPAPLAATSAGSRAGSMSWAGPFTPAPRCTAPPTGFTAAF